MHPVFVIGNGQSGLTLLRSLLDDHPDLACPPETNLAVLCVELTRMWSLIEGDEAAAAVAGVRHVMAQLVAPYLLRRGKRRYCDMSTGTARFAELLRGVYPEAKFVCVYRHPADATASDLEARVWADHTAAMLAVEERFPADCHRIQYEDLAEDPQGTADRLFAFLEAAPAPRRAAAGQGRAATRPGRGHVVGP